jgi:PAS domain S-box-containing protein
MQRMSLLARLLHCVAFDPPGLTPHGFCLTWDPGLIWLHAGSDALIALAYFSIPLTLIRLVQARGDAKYRWVAWLFASFILACGSTHAMSILTLWVPAYRAEGALKLLTAVLSVGTALALRPLVPVVLALPSRSQMERLNRELQQRVAELEQAGAALRENQTRLMLAQEAGQVGSWDVDVQGDVVYWSAAQYALYGLEPDVVLMTRQAWLACLEPEDRDAAVSHLAQAVAGGTDYEAEFCLRLPDGGRRWVAERGRVVAGEQGGGARMVGCSVDITERKRLAESNQALTARAAEDAYARELAAEQMRVMFEHSPDALFVVRVEDPEADPTEAQFVFEAINPAAGRLTGLPVGSLIGLRPDQTHPPHEAEELLAAYRACAARGGPMMVVQRRTVRGTLRQFETALAPVRDPRSGRIERIMGVARDATERNEMESQLRHLAKVEATNRLSAGIAHDFNNLLQALMGGLEMLLVETAGMPAHSYAEVALQAAQRGAELTHRLLAYARQQMLQPQPVDASKLLAYVTGLLEHSLPHQVRIAVALSQMPAITLADPGQLEAAIVNLVVNAADAMPSGGSIEVGAAPGAPPAELGLPTGPYVVVSVADTGVGMDPAVLQQCCEPFFTTKGPRGSGLGLSMVQGFARQSGGELAIRSTPGQGTEIRIWLPAAQPDASEAEAAPEPAHVLLVDDAPDVLVTAGAFLRHSGFQVTRVGTGHEALAHLQQGGRCDALVTDFCMPDLNGFELLDQARALRPQLPALIITGFDRRSLDDYDVRGRVLQKPFGRLTLVAEVQALLDEAGIAHRPLEPTGRRDHAAA